MAWGPSLVSASQGYSLDVMLRLLIVVACCGAHVESSQIRYWTCVFCTGRWILIHYTSREVLKVSFNKFYIGFFSPLKMWPPWREKPDLEIFQSTSVFYTTRSPGARRRSDICLSSAMRSWGTHVHLTNACLLRRWECGNFHVGWKCGVLRCPEWALSPFWSEEVQVAKASGGGVM